MVPPDRGGRLMPWWVWLLIIMVILLGGTFFIYIDND